MSAHAAPSERPPHLGACESAAKAIAEAAEHLAGRARDDAGEVAAEVKGRAEALDTLAAAVSKLVHGPQGGTYKYRSDQDYRYLAGTIPSRSRGSLGFASGENGRTP